MSRSRSNGRRLETVEPQEAGEKRSRRHTTVLAAVAIATWAPMFFLGTGLRPVWWLTWFAPLPVLLVARRMGAWQTFAVAAIAWSIGGLNFPALSRQYRAAGVGLLLVPAWDFTLDGWLHGRMAIMRGVESGFSIARIAKQGQLTVSDDRGRVLAEESSAAAPFSTLMVVAPVRHDDTLYLRFGDYFAWANVAGFLFVLFSRTPKIKHPHPEEASVDAA